MDQIRMITAGCCALLPEDADRVEAADQDLDLAQAGTAHWYYTMPFPGVRYYSFEAPKKKGSCDLVSSATSKRYRRRFNRYGSDSP